MSDPLLWLREMESDERGHYAIYDGGGVLKERGNRYKEAADEIERLREGLTRIANHGPGYGEECEYMAQIARHTLDPELARLSEAKE